MTLRPTPPTPNTAQVSPCPRFVRFHTDPMPVSTPQPIRHATDRSMSSSILTHWMPLTTVCSAKNDAAAKFHAASPPTVNGWLALAMLLRHHAGRPVLHHLQAPQ